MQTSEEINEIAAALAKAQSVIKNPEKTRMNPHFKAAYADLATGLVCIREALSKNGIAIVQAPDIRPEGIVLGTYLIHSSGQVIGCIYPVAVSSIDHQKLGAALTYAKRQSIFSLVGVVGDDDLDGEDIRDRKIGNGVDDAMVTMDQVEELRIKIEQVGADEQLFLKFLKVGSLAVLPAREYARAVSELDRKAARK